jgi:hypothetical protein
MWGCIPARGAAEMTGLATKLFGIPEEIVIGKPCPSHLYRWTIFGNTHFKVCLQHTIGNDGSREFYQDPMPFISVGVAQRLCTAGVPQREVISCRAAWMVLIGKTVAT